MKAKTKPARDRMREALDEIAWLVERGFYALATNRARKAFGRLNGPGRTA